MTERGERGVTVVEVVLVLGLVAGLAALALPVLASASDAARARQAAAFLAGRMRQARHTAAARSAAAGVVFDRAGTAWAVRLCVDGNGNGLRRAELAAGPDRCLDDARRVDALFPGVAVAVDAALRGPGGEPGSADPVRFGPSDLASFSPAGSGTSGTVFVRSARGVQYAVRVAGATGRTRVLRFHAVSGEWRTP